METLQFLGICRRFHVNNGCDLSRITCSSCSASVLPNTTMSSAIATTLGRPSNVWSTFFSNTSCAETSPNGRRRKQYRSYGVLNVVSSFNSLSDFMSSILIVHPVLRIHWHFVIVVECHLGPVCSDEVFSHSCSSSLDLGICVVHLMVLWRTPQC